MNGVQWPIKTSWIGLGVKGRHACVTLINDESERDDNVCQWNEIWKIFNAI